MPRAARAVGRNVLRTEGVEKVTGAARYIDDLAFPGMLYGRTIRSTIPAGDIVDVRPDFSTPGYTIVSHRDIPGRNRAALHAAEVRVDYRETTPNYDPEASATTFKTVTIAKGDLGQGFAAADVVV